MVQMGKTEIRLIHAGTAGNKQRSDHQFLPALKMLIYIVFAIDSYLAPVIIRHLILSLAAKIATALFRQKLTF